MRKLKLQMQISIDGFVGGPQGELDWTTDADPTLWQFMHEVVDGSNTLLLGRKIAQDFVGHFEAFTPDHPKFTFAQKMVNIRRIIFSRTLNHAFGVNTTLAKGDLSEEIAKLKNENGKDILVYGGAGFISSLVAGGHIDEFLFFVNPVMIHEGLRIFGLPGAHHQLSLINATPYPCGITVLHYALNKHSNTKQKTHADS